MNGAKVSPYLALILILLGSAFPVAAKTDKNPVMLQYFHWFSEADGSHWRELQVRARDLAANGFTSLWLPPQTKGMSGPQDVGYGLYDLYDLGEFNQKGAVRTKYGTKSEYLAAIGAAHAAGLAVYSDLILNHMGGASESEDVRAVRVDPEDRNREIGEDLAIRAWTRFTFPARAGAHSRFTWRWYHFDGTDWDHNTKEKAIFKFRGEHKHWDSDLDHEKGNYDYLLLNDLDLEHPDVRSELKSWGRWFVDETQMDGFRIDAAKHTEFAFTREWLEEVERARGKRIFAVGEYWSHDLRTLGYYIDRMNGRVSLFDFIFQDRLARAGRERGYFDMARIYDGTLVAADPEHAVTFTDNHDTQRHLSTVSKVEDWFKPLAYTFLLLRREGYPCVFYPDYFGASYRDPLKANALVEYAPLKDWLDLLLALRRDYGHGPQHSYLDDRDIVGWTREGDGEHPKAMAVVVSDNMSAGGAGQKRMFVGASTKAERIFTDRTGHFTHQVSVGPDGMGTFAVKNASDSVLGQSVSVWVEL